MDSSRITACLRSLRCFTRPTEAQPRLIAALVLLGSTIATHASAQNVWFVTDNPGFITPLSGTSWANPAPLDYALTNAASNDEIRCKEGFYVPASIPGAPSPRDATYLINKPLTVRGGYRGSETTAKPLGSALNTILSGEIGPSPTNTDNLYHVVTITAPSMKVTVDRFTIESGKASDLGGVPFPPNDPRGRGAGITISAGSTVSLSNLLIRENSSTGVGAGIAAASATVTITQSTFVNNVAYNSVGPTGGRGGGMHASRCDLRLVNVVFNSNGNNTAAGGAMFLNGGVAQFANCAFFSNYALDPTGTGGAMFLTGGNISTLWNCSFSENVAAPTAASAFTIDLSTNSTGAFSLFNSVVWSYCNAPGLGGSTHFQAGAFSSPNVVASSCALQPIGWLPPPPAGGPGSFIAPGPNGCGSVGCVSWLCPAVPNLSLDPAVNPAYAALVPLPADFADIDGDANFAEALPMDRERLPRIPAGGVLQIGAYASAYSPLTVP